MRAYNSAGNSGYSNTASGTTSGGGGRTNVALNATASASSETPQHGQTADKANDGVIDGWPGDYTKEWVVDVPNDAWLQLDFPNAVTIDSVVLYDRQTLNEHITGGQLTFDSGSAVNTGSLNNDGTAKTVTFSSRTVNWLRFTVTSYNGNDIGLMELEVFGTSASKAECFSTAITGSVVTQGIPKQFKVSPIYPNPVNPSTMIDISVPDNGYLTVIVYNVFGQEIRRLYEGGVAAGRQSLLWRGRNQRGEIVSTGVYLLRVEYAGLSGRQQHVETRRVVLVR